MHDDDTLGRDPVDEDEEGDDADADEGDDADETAQTQQPERKPNPVAAGAVGIGTPIGADGKPRVRKSRRSKKMQEAAPKEQRGGEHQAIPADLVWEQVIEEVRADGGEPEYVRIRVSRVDVGREQMCEYLEGSAVMGDEYQTPAEALFEAVENVHLAENVRGPALYNCSFLIRGGSIGRKGQLKLGSAEAINRRRHQQWYPGTGAQQQQGHGVPRPPRRQAGVGAPPPGYEQQEPQRDERRDVRRDDRYDDRDRDRDRYDDRRDTRGPRGYGGPRDYRQDRMEREIDDLKTMIKDLATGLGRPQPIAPQQDTMEVLAKALKGLEGVFGVKLGVMGQGVGLGAPQVLPALPAATPREDDNTLEGRITKKLRVGLEKNADKMLSKLLDPDAEEEEEDEDEDDKPEADVEVVELPVPWPGTDQPMKYIRNKETGETDTFKSFLVSPYAEKYGGKVLDVAGSFADAIKAAVSGKQQPPQQLPPRESMNGTGVGGPPPQQQEVAQTAPPPPGDDDPFGL